MNLITEANKEIDFNLIKSIFKTESNQQETLIQSIAKTKFKSTEALYFAAEHGHLQLAKALLENLKSKPNLLLYAASRGSIETIEFLLSSGFDPNFRCKSDHFLTFLLASKRLKRLVLTENQQLIFLELIRKHRKLVEEKIDGHSLVDYAIHNEMDQSLVTALIANERLNYDPNKRSATGLAPIHRAIENGDVHVLLDFLEHPRVNTEITYDISGLNLIHFAVAKGSKDILHLLLNHKKTNQLATKPDFFNRTPLDFALIKNEIDKYSLIYRLTQQQDISLEEIHAAQWYHLALNPTDQMTISRKLKAFLRINAVPNEKLAEFGYEIKGHCAGLNFLFAYYRRKDLNRFHQELQHIVDWDETEATLDKPSFLSEKYQTLRGLIQQWCNDIFLFQSGSKVLEHADFNQNNHSKIYEIVKEDQNSKYVQILPEDPNQTYRFGHLNNLEEQLDRIVNRRTLFKLDIEEKLGDREEKHQSTLIGQDDGLVTFYDPRVTHKMRPLTITECKEALRALHQYRQPSDSSKEVNFSGIFMQFVQAD